jgi:hypothetical protein
MSYVIVTLDGAITQAITASKELNKFFLVPLDSDVAINKVFSHPHRAGAQQILNWINKNSEQLACQNLSIQDEARFRK